MRLLAVGARLLAVVAWIAAATVMLASAVVVASMPASADPGDEQVEPPPPVQPGVPRPMPADPPRVNPIGGARVSSTTPQGETAGLEPALAAQAERGEATVPMWAKDGIFAPTLHPNRHLVIHLPGELGLGPAAWTGDGGAIYGSNDVDYAVIPFTGGGADITVTRKTVFSSSTIPFGVKLPAGTHLRQGDNVVVVETDAVPGRPAAVIGTFSIPAAHDRDQVPLTVTPTLGPGFPPGQSDLTIDLGPANIFAFPVTITLSYRSSDIASSGAPIPNWQGLPPGAGLAAPQASVNPAPCPGGVNDYRSPDGRAADFTPACARRCRSK
ncbi:MAG: hypothetical protein U5N53_12495 [Mycobacterium sp.]|nr:hypothetical protein [Mycobacterium sp.]